MLEQVSTNRQTGAALDGENLPTKKGR